MNGNKAVRCTASTANDDEKSFSDEWPTSHFVGYRHRSPAVWKFVYSQSTCGSSLVFFNARTIVPSRLRSVADFPSWIWTRNLTLSTTGMIWLPWILAPNSAQAIPNGQIVNIWSGVSAGRIDTHFTNAFSEKGVTRQRPVALRWNLVGLGCFSPSVCPLTQGSASVSAVTTHITRAVIFIFRPPTILTLFAAVLPTVASGAQRILIAVIIWVWREPEIISQVHRPGTRSRRRSLDVS